MPWSAHRWARISFCCMGIMGRAQQSSEATDCGAEDSRIFSLPSSFLLPACLGAPAWQTLHRLSSALQGLTSSDGPHGCMESNELQMSAGALTCTACHDLHNEHVMTCIYFLMCICISN